MGGVGLCISVFSLGSCDAAEGVMLHISEDGVLVWVNISLLILRSMRIN